MISENASNIENAVIATLNLDKLPTEDEIASLVQKLLVAFPVEETEVTSILRRLHARLQIDMDTGIAIKEDHQSWFPSRKADIDPYYWTRYAKYLNRGGWPPKVVNTLDRVTDDIIDLLGDPAKPSTWLRRGLVMGDVQSGKTSTYTALCCKAADTGYRLIILLTGTIESLRRQTQGRLDAGFVGLDSSGLLNRERQTREVGVGQLDKRRTAGVFTSTTSDFKSTLINLLGFKLNTFAEPVLVVVKKNKRILENLENWLRSYNADGNGKIDTPLLLIDDEADNASVNTNSPTDDPTAINERIRALLNLFTRSSYIGFTATPFANIFIDPDSENAMVGDDLFPRHFIYALEAPSNYLGAQSIFGDDAPSSCLCEIDDADDIFPARHRQNLAVDELPASLYEALNSFILANAIRDLRGETSSHRSMLVNVSRFTNVQERVRELIDHELRTIQSEIQNYSQLDPGEACRSKAIADLKNTWEQTFMSSGFAWPEVQRSLKFAALPIQVRSVNQRSGAASLDYSIYRENGLRVIAVGGNSLSRGLTLEGLSTSYFFRNSQMYDTLLQMGRWFGYRDGYDDLCRVWLSDEATHWYRHISFAADELRSEIRRMQALSLTPKDFGLKVRSHPDALIVTARNKMRAARTIERIISVSGQGFETARLLMPLNAIRANVLAAELLLSDLAISGVSVETSEMGNLLWRDAPKKVVCQFLRRFENHPLNIHFQRDELTNEDLPSFLENTDEPVLQKWDIVLPSGSGTLSDFAGHSYNPQKRKITISRDTQSILVSGEKRRVGSRGIEKEGIPQSIIDEIENAEEHIGKNVSDKAYRARRLKPLLMLHLVAPFLSKEVPYDTNGQPLVAIGLSFPSFDDSNVARRVRYRINLVEWRNMFMSETDDEEMELDDDPV